MPIALLLCAVCSFILIRVPYPMGIVIVAGLLLAPLAIRVILRLPFLLCLGFVLFSLFRIHEVFPILIPLHIPQLLALGAIAALAYHVGVAHNVDLYWTPALVIFALFFILVVVSVMFAFVRSYALEAFISNYVKIGIMLPAIVWFMTQIKHFVTSTRLIILLGTIVGLIALYNKAQGLELVEGTRVTIGRSWGSILGDPNDLSLVLLFPIGFTLSVLLSPWLGRISRLLAVLSFIILAAAIIATQSRGGLLGLAATVGIFFYRRTRSIGIVLLVVAVCTVFLYTFAGITDRATTGSIETGLDESAMGRFYAWQAAFNMALDNPLTGVGLNNFLVNYFLYTPVWDGVTHAVHSTWFQVLAEIGFVGLVIFIIFIAQLLYTNSRTMLMIESLEQQEALLPIFITAQAVYIALIGFIVSSSFLTQAWTWQIYLLAALTIASSHYTRNYIRNENTEQVAAVGKKP